MGNGGEGERTKKGKRGKSHKQHQHHQSGQQVKIPIEGVKAVLGFRFDPKNPIEGVVDLIDDDLQILNTWERMTSLEKQRVVVFNVEDVDKVTHELRRLNISVKLPTEETAKKAMAKFVMAMEQGVADVKASREAEEAEEPEPELVNVFVGLHDPSLEELVVYHVLKKNLALFHAHSRMTEKFFFVAAYFCWYSSSSWMVGLTLVVLFVFLALSEIERIQRFRASLCTMLFKAFSSEKDASYVEWKADSFISAVLLVTLTSGTEWYIFIVFFISLPYLFGYLEDWVTDISDFHSVSRLRVGFTYLNKIVLGLVSLYSWSSLLLVAALFFQEIATLAIKLAIAFTSLLISTLLRGFLWFVPERMKLSFAAWIRKPLNLGITIFTFAFIQLYTVWATWDWEYGGVLRPVLLMVSLHFIPFDLLVFILELAMAVGLSPYLLLNWIVHKMFGINNNEDDAGDTSTNAHPSASTSSSSSANDNFLEKLYRQQEEERRRQAEDYSR